MTEQKKYYLEFERPLAELEEKIRSLKISSSTDDKKGSPSVAAEGENITPEIASEIKTLEESCARLKNQIYGQLTPWQKVLLARHPDRPYLLDYIPLIFEKFIELKGDRLFSDDKAIVAGLGRLDGIPCVIVGHQKGRTLEEKLLRNYAMPNPEGYRKALRIMKLAEKFSLPVFTFIDTPGAYPGVGAEERGQAEAIARNLKEMASLKTPIIATIIGEGGSGGALGIGVADKILIMENAYYSVISPEGCSAILFKDASRAPDAASALKLTASDLLELGIADEIIPEPLGGADKNPTEAALAIKRSLKSNLASLSSIPIKKLLDLRYKKYRSIGDCKRYSITSKRRTSRRKKAEKN